MDRAFDDSYNPVVHAGNLNVHPDDRSRRKAPYRGIMVKAMPHKEMRTGGIRRGRNINPNQTPRSIKENSLLQHRLIIRKQIETK